MNLGKLNNQSGGYILIVISVMLTFLVSVALAVTQLSYTSFVTANQDRFIVSAQLAADGGVDYAMNRIAQTEDWTGIAETELHNDGTVRTTYEVDVFNPSIIEKYIEVTGRVYSPVGSTDARSTRTLRVDLRPVVFGSASVQTGNGGLIMDNNATIIAGSVFVNGTLTMNNNAQIGLSVGSVDSVEVAHNSCPQPANATYPRQCGPTEAGEPVDINGNARIYSLVYATNQTTSDGMYDPDDTSNGGAPAEGSGLVPNQTVPPKALPTHDRAAQIAAVEHTLTSSQASCTFPNLTKTLEANTRVTGNLEVSSTCDLIIEGDVWIEGNLIMQNSADLVVSDILNDGPTIMVDGQKMEFKNASAVVSNALGLGARLINYWSAAACSPNCTDVTGADLRNSQNVETISINNSLGAPNSVFYAKWSKLTLNNSGSIGALVAQTIHMKNNSVVTFGTDTTAGNSRFWVIDLYRRLQ